MTRASPPNTSDPVTCVGSSWCSLSPSPSWPFSPLPQAHASPSSVTMVVKPSPQATAIAGRV
eukprot:CAMPEP_0179482990 /NCGR_PEP_ID=MMETSP0799-20121207/60338_1 /TAXON_ID=46947 /ORGANISM="Geminigera cryophila, Strain CCMP2564" /LENGTH=61 /DNA_ID=CAMNT_0021296389 /DNA_START=747 /DNA_END=932 /DNA_ORIENTATION=+